MRKRLDAFAVYIILQVSASLLFSLIFTVNMVYHGTLVGLSPLQLVLPLCGAAIRRGEEHLLKEKI